MKNRREDAYKKSKRCTSNVIFFKYNYTLMGIKKPATTSVIAGFMLQLGNYFFKYITSFTSFTVRGTSGRAPATRFGA